MMPMMKYKPYETFNDAMYKYVINSDLHIVR